MWHRFRNKSLRYKRSHNNLIIRRFSFWHQSKLTFSKAKATILGSIPMPKLKLLVSDWQYLNAQFWDPQLSCINWCPHGLWTLLSSIRDCRVWVKGVPNWQITWGEFVILTHRKDTLQVKCGLAWTLTLEAFVSWEILVQKSRHKS